MSSEDETIAERPEEQRHLAAIVFTDVAGYSARMQRDERGTLAAVRADFDRMRKLCRKYRGEVLNTMGDGMLLCFSSAVKAVAFSLQVQSEFGKRVGAGAPDGPLEHRIGIHVGDIFRHEGQVAGDGVNIAARLQTKAPPGGICVSQIVYDMVNGKMPLQAEPLGVQEFKNISKLSVYCLSVSAASAARARAIARRYPAKIMAAVAVAGAIAIGFLIWKRVPRSAPEKSIAVLPFANLSPAPENAFFADGIHEDLITNLARISDLKVISRTSVLAYRDPGARNLRRIASELGVANVLEGSVRREGSKVRITAQLIDARTDQHLWAETYDREVKDAFEVQGAIAEEIAKTLAAGFKANERAAIARRPTKNPEAYDAYLKARTAAESLGGSRREDYERTAMLYEQALKLDPAFAVAWGELSTLHAVMYWWGTLDPSADRKAKAKAALDAAARIAPDAAETHVARGNFAYRCENDWAGALKEYEAAQRSLPNDAELLVDIGAAQRRLGRWNEAFAAFEQAARLNPNDAGSVDAYLNTAIWLRRYELVRKFGPEYTENGMQLKTLRLDRNRWLAEMATTGQLDHITVRNPTPFERYQDALDTGNFEGAAAALNNLGSETVQDAGGVANEPVALHRAQLAFAQGNAALARQAGAEALAYYRSQTWTPRQESVALAGRARAEALAGNTAEAIKDARDALERTLQRDKFNAVLVQLSLGEVYVITGERAQALGVLRDLMAGPCPKPAAAFALDPVWSRVAREPEFKDVLKTAKPL